MNHLKHIVIIVNFKGDPKKEFLENEMKPLIFKAKAKNREIIFKGKGTKFFI